VLIRRVATSLLCCIALIACSGHEPRGTVSGTLTLSGGETAGSTPVRGTVKAQPVAGGVITEVPVSDDGRFEIRLRPGDYKLTGTSPLFGSGAYECFVNPPTNVSVGDSTAIAVTVVCPMG
jgi:hypothetical protein